MNKPALFGCLGLVLLGLFILGIGGCVSHNGLVSKRGGVEAQWAQVENVYQRRFDLIPNLVRTVEAQANFEKSTLTEIATARASINQIKLAPGSLPDDTTFQKLEEAQGRLGGALGRLLSVSENYPDLKANQAFIGLQAELAGTENRIAVERNRFNEAARIYNTAVQKLPTSLYAGAMGFTTKPYFTAKAEAAEPPKVEFNQGR